ncbi:MAG: hypothetical protein KF795_27415 [Labilithrix sp.]|nr:hypothetical protein [Labilithrix sp.]
MVSLSAMIACAPDGAVDGGSSAASHPGDGSDGSSASREPPKDASYIAVRVHPAVARTASTGGLKTKSFTGGQTSAVSLESLKYLITRIAVCESMETQGTAFQKQEGCLDLYQADIGEYAYTPSDADFTAHADRARTSDDRFVDLMDPSSRERLAVNAKLGASDARKYSWGLVTWALPIKVKASMPMSDGTTFFTHDGVTERRVDHNGFVSYPTVASRSFLDGPAEEAVVLHGNGGTWFRFQSPLTITQSDIDAHESYVLDLVFNPDGLVKGYGSTSNAVLVGPSNAGHGGPGIGVPQLDLTPVPHRAGDVVVKESYVAAVGDFRVRLELYSLKSDPERTIYGVDAKSLFAPDVASGFSDFSKISFVEEGPDGAIAFKVWDHSDAVSGFHRLASVGESTEATIHCIAPGDDPRGGAFSVMFEGCSGGAAAVEFFLDAIDEL